MGTVFARLGHEVIFGYSHNPQKLQRLAVSAGAISGFPHDAADASDIIVLIFRLNFHGQVHQQRRRVLQ
ncbi:hypothetical protein D4100_04210 [Serratia inhibens]|uniref:Pyrroline-5-carboxylate reductase catalytic N-terminal domain-containing protein n=1 Tax=Serratia inhibens TaxID=2338073 RepID=A0AA92X8V5_9GAMM|nr:hypothetical protein D4100_04210 [Serratia inhibens]